MARVAPGAVLSLCVQHAQALLAHPVLEQARVVQLPVGLRQVEALVEREVGRLAQAQIAVLQVAPDALDAGLMRIEKTFAAL